MLSLHTIAKFQNFVWLNFEATNQELGQINLRNTQEFSDYVFDQIPAGKIGIGGWLEDRVLYARSEHFSNSQEPRTIHLGLDFWVSAYTPITCPENGVVHSFANNNNFGDYGPTLILEHKNEQNKTYYTLYGHLSLESIQGIYKNQKVSKGEVFAEVGKLPENGDWPPHLHFQVMNSMEGNEGDYPGVCSYTDLEHYKSICLDPMEYLGIKKAST